MGTKIYKVISHDVYLESGEDSIDVKVFTDEKLATKYYKKLVKKDKQNDFEPEDYTVDEDKTSYERYLTGRSSEDSISIYLQEDEICEELEKSNKKNSEKNKEKNDDMEKDYEF